MNWSGLKFLSFRKYLLPALACAALVTGAVWGIRELRQPHRTLAAGLEALEQDDRREVERLIATLQRRGHDDHAAYLRSRIPLHQAQTLLARATALLHGEERTLAGRSLAAILTSELEGYLPARPAGLFALGTANVSARLDDLRHERLALDPQIATAYEDAFHHARSIPPEGPLGVEAAIVAGECLVRLGDMRGAASAWAFVAKRRPDHADAHRHLAVIAYDTGAMLRAVELLEALAQLEPRDGRPHRQIGLIMKDDKQPRRAIDAYREALRRDLSPAARADVVKELTELWLGEGETDYDEALATLRQCPREYAERVEMLALHAQALWKSRRNEAEAIALAERALRINPEQVEALMVRAEMYLDVEEPQRAIVLLERAARRAPHHAQVRTRIAQAYERLAGQLEAAAILFEAQRGLLLTLGTPAILPNPIPAFHQALIRPRAAEHARRREETQKRIETLSRLSREAMERTDDDKVRCAIARLWLEMGDPRQARMWFRAALTCDPRNAEARQGLAQLDSGLPR